MFQNYLTFYTMGVEHTKLYIQFYNDLYTIFNNKFSNPLYKGKQNPSIYKYPRLLACRREILKN